MAGPVFLHAGNTVAALKMTLPCSLTAKQESANQLLGGPQRHTMLVGGSRSGKTWLLVRAIFIRALRSPGSRHAIFRLRMNAARQSIWLETIPKVVSLCFPGLELTAKERDGYFLLPNGSEIWVGGLDDKERVDRILGKEYVTLYYNECSQIPYDSVTTARTRLAQKCDNIRAREYYDLNPTGTAHWTYRLFVEHKAPGSLEKLANPGDYRYMYLNPVDNKANLESGYIDSLMTLPERKRRRFLVGEYTADIDGALWTLEMIEQTRVLPDQVPWLQRVVVAVDPSGSRGSDDLKSDAIGLVVAGLAEDGHCYVLEDATGHYSPEQWGTLACQLYDKHNADMVVYERNFGGDMVRAVIQGQNAMVPCREVTASRGKHVRAEPVSAAFERQQVHHAGDFPMLEDEMCNFTTAGYIGSGSPNRADALVWAITELMLSDEDTEQIMVYDDPAVISAY